MRQAQGHAMRGDERTRDRFPRRDRHGPAQQTRGEVAPQKTRCGPGSVHHNACRHRYEQHTGRQVPLVSARAAGVMDSNQNLNPDKNHVQGFFEYIRVLSDSESVRFIKNTKTKIGSQCLEVHRFLL
jgi:hypothetical protein